MGDIRPYREAPTEGLTLCPVCQSIRFKIGIEVLGTSVRVCTPHCLSVAQQEAIRMIQLERRTQCLLETRNLSTAQKQTSTV